MAGEAGEVSSIGVRLTLDTSSFDSGMTAAGEKLAALEKRASSGVSAMQAGGGRPVLGAGQGMKVDVTLSVGASSLAALRKRVQESVQNIPVTFTAGRMTGSSIAPAASTLSATTGMTRQQAELATQRAIDRNYGSMRKYASGGIVAPGRPHLVGELRPEVFVPKTAGVIEPSVQEFYRKQMQALLIAQGLQHRAAGGMGWMDRLLAPGSGKNAIEQLYRRRTQVFNMLRQPTPEMRDLVKQTMPGMYPVHLLNRAARAEGEVYSSNATFVSGLRARMAALKDYGRALRGTLEYDVNNIPPSQMPTPETSTLGWRTLPMSSRGFLQGEYDYKAGQDRLASVHIDQSMFSRNAMGGRIRRASMGIRALAEQARQLTIATGGSTLPVMKGYSLPEDWRYAVGVLKGTAGYAHVDDPEEFAHVFRRVRRRALNMGVPNVGTWWPNQEAGDLSDLVHIDPSVVLKNRSLAIQMGKFFSQEAIFDRKTFSDIPTPGKSRLSLEEVMAAMVSGRSMGGRCFRCGGGHVTATHAQNGRAGLEGRRFLDAAGKILSAESYFKLPVSMRDIHPLEAAAYDRQMASYARMTPQEIAEAQAWYPLVHLTHEAFSKRSGLPMDLTIGAAATSSPRAKFPQEHIFAGRLAPSIAALIKKHPNPPPKMLMDLAEAARQGTGLFAKNTVWSAEVLAGQRILTGRKISDYKGSIIDADVLGQHGRLYGKPVPEWYTNDIWQNRMLQGVPEPSDLDLEWWAARTGGLRAALDIEKVTGLVPFDLQAASWIQIRRELGKRDVKSLAQTEQMFKDAAKYLGRKDVLKRWGRQGGGFVEMMRQMEPWIGLQMAEEAKRRRQQRYSGGWAAPGPRGNFFMGRNAPTAARVAEFLAGPRSVEHGFITESLDPESRAVAYASQRDEGSVQWGLPLSITAQGKVQWHNHPFHKIPGMDMPLKGYQYPAFPSPADILTTLKNNTRGVVVGQAGDAGLITPNRLVSPGQMSLRTPQGLKNLNMAVSQVMGLPQDLAELLDQADAFVPDVGEMHHGLWMPDKSVLERSRNTPGDYFAQATRMVLDRLGAGFEYFKDYRDLFNHRAGGGRGMKGAYIVGEIGDELFVPNRLAGLIPKGVMDQIPKAEGGMQVIGKRRDHAIGGELFFPPEDGWIIPHRLMDKVPRAAAGIFGGQDFGWGPGMVPPPPGGAYANRPVFLPGAFGGGRWRGPTGFVGEPAELFPQFGSPGRSRQASVTGRSAFDWPASEMAAAMLRQRLGGGMGTGLAGRVTAQTINVQMPSGGQINFAGSGPVLSQPGPPGRPGRGLATPPRGRVPASQAIPPEMEGMLRDIRTGASFSAQMLAARTPRGMAAVFGSALFGGRAGGLQQLGQERLAASRFEAAARSLGSVDEVRRYQHLMDQLATARGADEVRIRDQIEAYKSLSVQHKEFAESHDNLIAAMEKGQPGVMAYLRNFGSIIIATQAYSMAMQGVSKAMEVAQTTAAPIIDQWRGWASIANTTTGELGKMIDQSQGNVAAVMNQYEVQNRLGADLGATITEALTVPSAVKAGAIAGGNIETAVRAAVGTIGGGVPAGTYRGSTGPFESWLLASDKGAMETLAGALESAMPMELFRRIRQNPTVEAQFQDVWARGMGRPDLAKGVPITAIAADEWMQRAQTTKDLVSLADQATNRAERRFGDQVVEVEWQIVGKDAAEAFSKSFMEATGQALPTGVAELVQRGAVPMVEGRLPTTVGEADWAAVTTAAGMGLLDPASWAKEVARMMSGQQWGEGQLMRRQLEIGQPYAMSQQLLANPLLRPGAGVTSLGVSAGMQQRIGASLEATGGAQRFVSAYARAGAAAQRSEIDRMFPISEVSVIAEDGKPKIMGMGEAFTFATNKAQGLSRSIASLSEEILDTQRAASDVSYANQIRLATRGLGDALGLLGEVGGTRLGYLQREEFLTGRASQSLGLAAQKIGLASQRLSLALEARSIATQLAVAQFQAPGETGEERYARQREQIIGAGIRRQQLGFGRQQQAISEEQLGLAQRQFVIAGKIWAESAQRAAVDARKAITVMQAARDAEVFAFAAQKEVAAASQKMGVWLQQAATFAARAERKHADIIGQAVQGFVAAGDAVTAFATALSEALGVKLEGKPGSETVATLRNPRKSSVHGESGGGGGSHVTVNISGTQVRDDRDIERMANRIAHQVERVMSRKGQMLGLRQPAY